MKIDSSKSNDSNNKADRVVSSKFEHPELSQRLINSAISFKFSSQSLVSPSHFILSERMGRERVFKEERMDSGVDEIMR